MLFLVIFRIRLLNMVYFRQIKYRRLEKYLRGVIFQISTNIVWLQDNTYWQQLCFNSYIPAKYRKNVHIWQSNHQIHTSDCCDSCYKTRANWRFMFAIYMLYHVYIVIQCSYMQINGCYDNITIATSHTIDFWHIL